MIKRKTVENAVYNTLIFRCRSGSPFINVKGSLFSTMLVRKNTSVLPCVQACEHVACLRCTTRKLLLLLLLLLLFFFLSGKFLHPSVLTAPPRWRQSHLRLPRPQHAQALPIYKNRQAPWLTGKQGALLFAIPCECMCHPPRLLRAGNIVLDHYY